VIRPFLALLAYSYFDDNRDRRSRQPSSLLILRMDRYGPHTEHFFLQEQDLRHVPTFGSTRFKVAQTIQVNIACFAPQLLPQVIRAIRACDFQIGPCGGSFSLLAELPFTSFALSSPEEPHQTLSGSHASCQAGPF
jgi:hypothetical protein